jgi:hypothetical protein
MSFLRRSFIDRPLVAGIVITVVTFALVGGILLTSTTLGCGPANQLGLKLQRCVSTSSVAANQSPSPYASPAQSPVTGQSESPSPNPNPASNPYPNPASNPYPNPASAPEPPTGGPASGAYPPFYPPASAGQPVAYSISCRLPIYSGQPGSGGFLVFPGGTYIADPSSAVTVPSPSPAIPSPSPQMGPGGPPGFYGLSYDRQYSRWLAVPFSWITPDGRRYAFATPNAIYVEDLGAGTLTALGQGHTWFIVGVQAAGVYAVQPNNAGLWLLSFSGATTQIVSTGWWQAVSAGAAYGTATSAVPQGVANTIIRYDLKTGTTEGWFTRDGASTGVTGFDSSGNPILTVYYYNQGMEVWLTTAPGEGTPILGPSEGLSLNGNVLGDANGIWMSLYSQNGSIGNQQEMALYVPGKGLYGMSNITGPLAGPCI